MSLPLYSTGEYSDGVRHRQIDFPQYSKLFIVPAKYGSGSVDADHTQHDVRAEQSAKRDADIVY